MSDVCHISIMSSGAVDIRSHITCWIFLTVKIIWNRSCKDKWNTRFMHGALGVSGYWEVSEHARTAMLWLHFLICLLFTLYVYIFQWYFLCTSFDWSYKMEIFCRNILNLFYFVFTFHLWALYFVAVRWNICPMQLWNSWRTCRCLGSRFET